MEGTAKASNAGKGAEWSGMHGLHSNDLQDTAVPTKNPCTGTGTAEDTAHTPQPVNTFGGGGGERERERVRVRKKCVMGIDGKSPRTYKGPPTRFPSVIVGPTHTPPTPPHGD
ncbi:hypothetical protein ACLOJK_011338 [Asimina triloba]